MVVMAGIRRHPEQERTFYALGRQFLAQNTPSYGGAKVTASTVLPLHTLRGNHQLASMRSER